MNTLAFLIDSVVDLVPAYNAPNPDPKAPENLDDVFGTFLAWLKWGGFTLGVGGLMICGVMMILGRRNRSHMAVEGATGMMWIVAGLSVIALASGIVGAVLEAAA